MKKRKLPPHIVLSDGRWRFIKKGAKSFRRKPIGMARRKYRYSPKRVYYHRARKTFGGDGGSMKGFLAPIVGGAGDVLIGKYIPIHGVASTISGMFLHDNATRQIGLNRVGESLALMLFGNGGTSGGGWI